MAYFHVQSLVNSLAEHFYNKLERRVCSGSNIDGIKSPMIHRLIDAM